MKQAKLFSSAEESLGKTLLNFRDQFYFRQGAEGWA